MASVILGSVLFGAVAALLAHGKARNALGWFIVGCLIGPFAMIVVLFPMALKHGVTRKCPLCLETIRADAKVCRYCRSDVRSLSPA